MKKLTITLGICLGLFPLYLLTLYFLQDALLFKPDTHYISPKKAGLVDVLEHKIPMSDGTKIMLWEKKGDKKLPALLFFHGNRGQIAEFAPQILRFNEKGYATFFAEYRGYGNSEGKINQKNMFSDGAEVVDWIKAKGYSKIILIGYSFGCAASIGVASHRSVDGLVLLAPFASLSRLVAEKYPFSDWVLKDTYPSEKIMRSLHVPVVIIHSVADTLIPVHHAIILAQQRKENTSLYMLDGKDHRGTFWDERAFLFISDWLKNHL